MYLGTAAGVATVCLREETGGEAEYRALSLVMFATTFSNSSTRLLHIQMSLLLRNEIPGIFIDLHTGHIQYHNLAPTFNGITGEYLDLFKGVRNMILTSIPLFCL